MEVYSQPLVTEERLYIAKVDTTGRGRSTGRLIGSNQCIYPDSLRRVRVMIFQLER